MRLYSVRVFILLPILLSVAACSKTERRTPNDSLNLAKEAFESKTYKKAIIYAEEVADSTDAQMILAKIHDDGLGVAENDSIAAIWYKKAAERGIAEAQSELGLMFLNGNGVTADYKAAAKWLKEAAYQGENEAQYYIGWMYEEGVFFKKDIKEATKWYKKSAENGNTQAAYKIKKNK